MKTAFQILLLIAMASFPASMALSQATESKFQRIVTEEDFVSKIVGKQLVYESGAIVIFLQDYTFGGGFSGSRVSGEWVWRDEQLCHQMNIGDKRYKVACKMPQIQDKRIRFIRDDGSFYGLAKIK